MAPRVRKGLPVRTVHKDRLVHKGQLEQTGRPALQAPKGRLGLMDLLVRQDLKGRQERAHG